MASDLHCNGVWIPLITPFDATGAVVPRSVLKLTVGSDHRVVNGAENARYLAEVKRLLEHPLLLTV